MFTPCSMLIEYQSACEICPIMTTRLPTLLGVHSFTWRVSIVNPRIQKLHHLYPLVPPLKSCFLFRLANQWQLMKVKVLLTCHKECHSWGWGDPKQLMRTKATTNSCVWLVFLRIPRSCVWYSVAFQRPPKSCGWTERRNERRHSLPQGFGNHVLHHGWFNSTQNGTHSRKRTCSLCHSS